MSRMVMAVLHRMNRGVLLCGGFLVLILIGAVLLALPISHTGAVKVSPFDAFYMSVSIVTVAGMSIFDIHETFSLFGQLVLLVLMEIGGLGVMTMMVLLSISTGRRIRLKERLILQDSFNLDTPQGMVALVRKIIFQTVLVEVASSIFYSFYFCYYYGVKGLYLGLWFGISSYTTCGLDLLGGDFSRMLMNPYVSLLTDVTVFLGSVGFLVLDDLWQKRCWRRLSLNSKFILTMEAILIPLGIVIYYALEGNNPATMGNYSEAEKWLGSLFMSLSSRSVGFSLFDVSGMMDTTVMVLMLLMIIGGAPVSTAGGLHTTTMGLLFLSIWAWIKGRQEVVIFHKQVKHASLEKASNVFTIFVVLAILIAFLLFLFEPMHFIFKDVLFEAVAALSTVGFSMGLTESWNIPCKIIIMVAIFIGRLSILTLAVAFAGSDNDKVKYPEENIVVG